MPHRLSTPSSTTSSAALSLHHCSACSEVSDSILSPYDAFNGPSDSSSDTGTSEKRFYALQTLLSIGEADPVQVAAALSSLDPDESLISLATHIVKIHFPRSGYLGNASTSLIREISQAWDAGYDEIRVAQRLRDGKVAPPSTGGCWPARVAASDEGNATVFIGGLTGDVTEYYLAAVFAVFGPYTGVKVLPPKSGTSYCGFVHYVHRSDAEVVVKVMQGFEMMGHRLRISWGRSTGHREETSEVYRGSSMRLESGGGDTNANRVSTFGQGYSESSAPATVDPNLIVQVAKQIDSKVAMEYLRLVDEKFKGDGAAFIDM
ncbi:hypothetical protein BD324DRAFT_116477 [Kockovaella imperatae]|uniref:RRM domain-containing protein n=1 Tax=Kockovaella imperatae TaxID=4999 RepID=A0A1Y1UAP0_9TREE|nr:hypothetical protein BD324DRAFT_116477 [Kockovaella imperatae]ORX35072.1 hypothetical protein BD324DRAFT_116477 [Kockovaella imperatae]